MNNGSDPEIWGGTFLLNFYTPPGGGCPGKSGLKGFLRKKSGLKEIKGFGKETKEIARRRREILASGLWFS